ncbi:Rab2a [Hexamita inflata]|uniref:Rab2a n=1 Tax=Hexamita inflata TaxID=28002 RepID=A0ABP1HP56_9EUKA
MNQNNDKTFKVIIEGSKKTSKKQLLCELIQQQFNQNLIGPDFGIEQVQYLKYNIKLQIWDTYKQQDHMKLIIQYYRATNIALLVYDVGQIETFKLCSMYIEQLRSECPQNTQIMLIGQQFKEERQVNVDEAVVFAEMHSLTYTEINYLEDTTETMSQLKQRIVALAINNELK